MLSRYARSIRRDFHCWATVIPGLESLFQYEVVKLGIGNKSTCVYRDYSGGADLQLNDEQFWRLMCCSRLVESARIRIDRFTLTNRRGVLTSLSEIPWEKYITKDDIVNVNSTVIKNNMFFPRDLNEIVMSSEAILKNAKAVVCEKKTTGKKLHFLVRRDNVTVSIDTGYQSSRGYREFTAETPLKETVAAAMCYTALRQAGRLHNNLIFFDFFCGSGILCSEMHSILSHDYPYLQRRRLLDSYHHGFENWPSHNKDEFDAFLTNLELESQQQPLNYGIVDSDLSARAIFCTKRNTENLYRKSKLNTNSKEIVTIPPMFSISQGDFESRKQLLIDSLKEMKEEQRNQIVILANPPIYKPGAGDFKDLDKLYMDLFELIYSLKKTQLLKSACVLIPYSMQFRLPKELTDMASLRQLKLGDHSLCMLSI